MAIVTADDLQLYLEDTVAANMPLQISYLSPSELTFCLELTVADYNETPPIFFQQYTLDTFPYRKLLLLGAAVEALHLTAMKELRGEMTYSDGGVSSTVYYKTPQFTQLKLQLQQEYKELKLRTKRQVNLKNGFGGMR